MCGQVLACAMVKPLGAGCDNEVVSELAAFCVHPDYRGSGRGDSLLAYLGDYAQCFSCTCHLLAPVLFVFSTSLLTKIVGHAYPLQRISLLSTMYLAGDLFLTHLTVRHM